MDLLGDPVSHISDEFLRRAANLALRAEGNTSPNPVVGCVLVADGEVVGEGFHSRAGRPHAEVEALTAAGDRARGATAYVTLEPCAHFGKTPPCADALIAAGVERVVIGMPDTNPVADGGAEKLRAAGIHVEFSEDPTPFREINRPWLKRLKTGLPYVTVKLGLSLDGFSCTDGNQRITVTGTAGREVTIAMRGRRAGVLVGRRTAEVDDPSLLRADVSPYPATRIILCTSALPSSGLKLVSDNLAPTLIVAPADLLTGELPKVADWVRFVGYDRVTGLAGALRAIANEGVDSVLVEPGPTLFSQFLESRHIDELVTVVAGGFLGAAATCSPVHTTLAGDILQPRFKAVSAVVHEGVSVTRWVPVAFPEKVVVCSLV